MRTLHVRQVEFLEIEAIVSTITRILESFQDVIELQVTFDWSEPNGLNITTFPSAPNEIKLGKMEEISLDDLARLASIMLAGTLLRTNRFEKLEATRDSGRKFVTIKLLRAVPQSS